jgi:two-component sensor histidine kinase
MEFSDFKRKKSRPLRDRRLTAINFVADAVNRSLDLREISDNALHAILAVANLEAGAMYRWSDSDQILRLFASRGLSEEFTRQVTVIHRGADAVLDAVLLGGTHVVQDWTVAVGEAPGSMAQSGFTSAILSPIRTQDKIVGLLVLGRYQALAFGHEDVDLIEVIANQIGIAITKAQLLQDLERKNELLELMIEEAHHRIKNNLQMISGLLQLEFTEAGEKLGPERLRHAMAQIQAIAQVHHLLSREMPEQVDAHALITAIINSLVAAVPGDSCAPQVALELTHLWLNADQAVALALIVNELVANALFHGRPAAGKRLNVRVQCRQAGTDVTVTVYDNGGGLKLPAGGEALPATGQGMNIMQQLTKVNLRGHLEIANRQDGLCAELRFAAAGQQTGIDFASQRLKMPAASADRTL